MFAQTRRDTRSEQSLEMVVADEMNLRNEPALIRESATEFR